MQKCRERGGLFLLLPPKPTPFTNTKTKPTTYNNVNGYVQRAILFAARLKWECVLCVQHKRTTQCNFGERWLGGWLLFFPGECVLHTRPQKINMQETCVPKRMLEDDSFR
jgi:hypothetical protein